MALTTDILASRIRLIARIWSTLSLAFLVFMVGSHLIGWVSSGIDSGSGFESPQEAASFLAFPISTVVGLAISWKWEGIGGTITIMGIIVFHIIRPDLLPDVLIDGLAAPGLLYLAYWLLSRKADATNKAV